MGPVSETYRYIVRSVGVRSGNSIVKSTRIAVHDVIGLLQNGETVDTPADVQEESWRSFSARGVVKSALAEEKSLT